MNNQRPDVKLSVVSSMYVTPRSPDPPSPAAHALAALRKLEVDWVDLYCFLPGDLTDADLSAPHRVHGATIASSIAHLNVDAWVRRWRGGAAGQAVQYYFANQRVRAFATNLPNVSSLDPDRRKETVEALENLLRAASLLDVPILEIVAGPDFVSKPVPRVDAPEPNMGNGASLFTVHITIGPDAAQQRWNALLESLEYLGGVASTLVPPVAIALEMEPGLSYLLNRWEYVKALFRDLEASHVFLNLDIGHALLMKEHERHLYRELSTKDWASRIVHAHISHHRPGAHVSDLPLKPQYRRRYQRWIDLVKQAWSSNYRSRFASDTIALELEAARSLADISGSIACLRHWIA